MHKIIRRYQWGGNTSYLVPYNNTSNLYQGIMTDYSQLLRDKSKEYSKDYNQLVQHNAKLGDTFSQSLLSNSSYNTAQQNLEQLGNQFEQNNPSKIKSALGKVKDGVGQVVKSNAFKIGANMLGATYDGIPTADKTINSNDYTMETIRGTLNKGMLTSGNPYLMAAGAVNTIIDKTGGFTDASQGLGSGTDTLNKIASIALPGAGWFTGKTLDYDMSDTLKQNRASYGGSYELGTTAEQNSGAKLLFGKGKANKMIAKANLQDIGINNIMEKNEQALTASNNPFIPISTQYRQNGGYQYNNVYSGKQGLKLDRDFAKKVVKLSKGKKSKVKDSTEDIQMQGVVEFKNGGAVNVIPDGALHKNKHHLENVDEKFEEVTAKGIPVITENEGGDITQHAEVEREEIIFNLDVTKQLEKLMEDGSDDAAIEAGKLLVHEILENTVDNTGLLKKIK